MDEKKRKVKTCSYEMESGQLCEKSLYDDEFCIFHSKDSRRKKDEFEDEFWAEYKRQKEDVNTFNFEGFVFAGDISFEGRTFEKDVNFYKTEFSGNANFYKTQFSRKVNFYSAQFFKNADFTESQFLNADFTETEFHGRTDFSDVQFKEVEFRGTKFIGETEFYNGKFLGKSDFTDSIFNKNAGFPEAKFRGDVNFTDAIFQANVDFSNAKFSEKAEFKKTKFSRISDFSDAKFSKYVEFGYAQFKDETNYNNTQFSKKVSFNNSQFNGEVYFFKTEFFGEADFNDAQFHGKTTFGGIILHNQDKFVMKGAYFYDVEGLTKFIEENKKRFKYSNETEFLPDNFLLYFGERTSSTYPIISQKIKYDIYLLDFKKRHPKLHSIWWLFADCGRSFLRWALWSLILAEVFTIIFSFFYYFNPLSFKSEVISSSWPGVSLMYYSIVTFTTLGFGDIVPTIPALQIIIIIEVIMGYVMLGGLISIFANVLARRS